MEECDEVLPEDLKLLLNCDDTFLTESDGPGACISKPGCVAELRNSLEPCGQPSESGTK